MVLMGPAASALRRPVGWGRALLTAFLLLTAFAWAILAGMVPPGWARMALAGGSLILLLIASFVSIPPLLRSSLHRWFHRTIEFQFTAAGLPFLLGLLVLLLAAFSSGNNLIYMIAACLLAALLTSGFASALNLSGMALRFHFPARIFAGQETPVQLVLENEKTFLPAYSLTILASSERLGAASPPPKRPKPKRRSAAPASRPAGRKRPRKTALSTAAGDGTPHMKPAYFPYIARRGRIQTTSTLRFPQRGCYSSASFALSTRFPFALIDKRRRFRPASHEEPILVYPAPAAAEAVQCHFPTLMAEYPRYQPGSGQELYRVRPHQQSDGVRRIHWKATARAGTLQSREFSHEASRRLRILFCLDDPELTAPQAEQVISLCAGLVCALATTDAWIEFEGRNSCAAPSASPRWQQFASSREAFHTACAPAIEQVDGILEYLALVDPSAPLLRPATAQEAPVEVLEFRTALQNVSAGTREI